MSREHRTCRICYWISSHNWSACAFYLQVLRTESLAGHSIDTRRSSSGWLQTIGWLLRFIPMSGWNDQLRDARASPASAIMAALARSLLSRTSCSIERCNVETRRCNLANWKFVMSDGSKLAAVTAGGPTSADLALNVTPLSCKAPVNAGNEQRSNAKTAVQIILVEHWLWGVQCSDCSTFLAMDYSGTTEPGHCAVCGTLLQ